MGFDKLSFYLRVRTSRVIIEWLKADLYTYMYLMIFLSHCFLFSLVLKSVQFSTTHPFLLCEFFSHPANIVQHSDLYRKIGCFIVSYSIVLVFFVYSLLLHNLVIKPDAREVYGDCLVVFYAFFKNLCQFINSTAFWLEHSLFFSQHTTSFCFV